MYAEGKRVRDALKVCQRLIYPRTNRDKHLQRRQEPCLLCLPRGLHLDLSNTSGLAIPVIENLASHQGTYDTLNLTDNSLTVLGNIPLGEPTLPESS
jgi:hypothetical protein